MTRTYYLTLDIAYYGGISVTDVDYMLHWPSGKGVEGIITGPICPPDFVVLETPLGVLGSVTFLFAAA